MGQTCQNEDKCIVWDCWLTQGCWAHKLKSTEQMMDSTSLSKLIKTTFEVTFGLCLFLNFNNQIVWQSNHHQLQQSNCLTINNLIITNLTTQPPSPGWGGYWARRPGPRSCPPTRIIWAICGLKNHLWGMDRLIASPGFHDSGCCSHPDHSLGLVLG